MKPIDMRNWRNWLIEKPSQEIYYSRMQPAQPCSVFAEVEGTVKPGADVIAMSGIGDNDAFVRGLEQRYNVVAALKFKDHHAYRVCDMNKMLELVAEYPDAVIMTTEKDAVKLSHSKVIKGDLRQKMFYERITMRFVGEGSKRLFDRIDNDIKNRGNDQHIRGLYSNSKGYK